MSAPGPSTDEALHAAANNSTGFPAAAYQRDVYGGFTPFGSWFSKLQSVGMKISRYPYLLGIIKLSAALVFVFAWRFDGAFTAFFVRYSCVTYALNHLFLLTGTNPMPQKNNLAPIITDTEQVLQLCVRRIPETNSAFISRNSNLQPRALRSSSRKQPD